MLSWIGINEQQNPDRLCSLSGYLYKMKKERKLLVPQWTKRWFAIEGKNLNWYHSPSDTEPSGSIELRRVSYITKFESQGVYSFIIGYPDRNLMLRCDTTDILEKWLRALNMQADISRGGNGTGMITAPAQSTNPEGKGKLTNKKKSSTLEGKLDQTLRQLDDLERQVAIESQDVKISWSSSNKERSDNHLRTYSSNNSSNSLPSHNNSINIGLTSTTSAGYTGDSKVTIPRNGSESKEYVRDSMELNKRQPQQPQRLPSRDPSPSIATKTRQRSDSNDSVEEIYDRPIRRGPSTSASGSMRRSSSQQSK